MQVKGKVAIVTGASSGIGQATAELLTKKGAKVVLAARSEDKLKTVSKQLSGSYAVPTDMTKEEDIKKMVAAAMKHFGRVDILVNNAGQGYDAPVEDIAVDTFQYVISLNLIGPLIAMQQVIPIMRSARQGSIVNISSGTALMFLPGMSAYSSIKRALVGISLTAREELAGDNIAVSVVYPYMTATQFEKNTIRDAEAAEENLEEIGGNLPPIDSADYVAEKILEAVEIGSAEVFAHGWMKNGM